MPKIAHTEAEHAARRSTDKLTRVATETTERGADAARESMQVAQRAAGAVGELQHETARRARRSAEDATELSQLFIQLFNEQVRHNLQAATALGRASNWGEVAKVQSEFVRGSFERMNQLNSRYLEIIQAGMKSVTVAGRT
jgi:hypothetical protein